MQSAHVARVARRDSRRTERYWKRTTGCSSNLENRKQEGCRKEWAQLAREASERKILTEEVWNIRSESSVEQRSRKQEGSGKTTRPDAKRPEMNGRKVWLPAAQKDGKCTEECSQKKNVVSFQNVFILNF